LGGTFRGCRFAQPPANFSNPSGVAVLISPVFVFGVCRFIGRRFVGCRLQVSSCRFVGDQRALRIGVCVVGSNDRRRATSTSASADDEVAVCVCALETRLRHRSTPRSRHAHASPRDCDVHFERRSRRPSTPIGVGEMSRRLSEATPPVASPARARHPGRGA